MPGSQWGRLGSRFFKPSGMRCRICGMISIVMDQELKDAGLCRACFEKNRAKQAASAQRRKPVVDFSDLDAVRRWNDKHPDKIGEETHMKYAVMLEADAGAG